VDVSRTYLPGIAGAAFDDPRARLLIADGIAFVRETDDRFDVILVDSTDPKGAAEALFADAFFRLCAHVLTPDGLLCMQSGSLSYQRDLAAGARTALSEIFPLALPYWAAIPTYPGTLWTFTLGSRRADPRRVDREAIARRTAGFDLRYYGPDVHHAALAMPALP
jgi:spermidine synthase